MEITDDMIDRAKELKRKSGKTYQDIADEAFMSTSMVQRYINGDVKDADPEAYGRMVSAIAGDVEQEPDEPPEPSLSADEIAQQHYRHMIATHEAELERMQQLYNRSIRYKNRWIIVLASLLLLFAAFTIIVLLVDIRNPQIGWFRHVA